MWRLVGGELLWALRQLVAAPWVLAGLLVGFAATLAVLDAAAPGPVLEAPWRILVAIGAGLLLASSARGIQWSTGRTVPHDREPLGPVRRPLTAATEVAGSITLLVLVAWLVTWGVTVVTG